jgi:hypothetical protein
VQPPLRSGRSPSRAWLPGKHRPNWYDAGLFWSGDQLSLSAGARLGEEIAVQVPADARVTR